MSETINLKLFKHDNPSTNENQFDVENALNKNWDKIDGAYGELGTNVQKIDKDISNIKTEQTEQNKRIEQTNNSLINITTEKSDNIHVEDSSNNVAKIGVFGVSKQETREGYNLLNVASSYEVTGSKTVAIKMPAGNYTIKADDITTDSEQTQFCFSFRDGSGAIADARISLSTKKITFALTREATSVVIYSGNSFNESQGVTTTYKNLMIYEGADDKEYEEYGKTPSPEIPSEIENVTGDIDITVCNKNLFDELWTGTTSTNFIPVFAGQKYIYSENGIGQAMNFRFYESKSGSYVTKWVGANIAYVPEKNGFVILDKSNTTKTKCMLEVGEIVTEYVQHEEQLITFPLSEGQKLMEGDYLADDGIHHKRKQIELNGTEGWGLSTLNNYQWFRRSESGVKKSSTLICNYFKNYRNIGNYIGVCNNDTADRIYMAVSEEITTVEQLKAWLAEKKTEGTPVIVEYELAEEEIEPYTPAQQEAYNKLQNVLSYKTVTNVFTDKALLEFKYIADTQTWVLNKLNNINQELLNIAGGN